MTLFMITFITNIRYFPVDFYIFQLFKIINLLINNTNYVCKICQIKIKKPFFSIGKINFIV